MEPSVVAGACFEALTPTHAELGMQAFDQGRFDTAVEHLSHAVTSVPNDPQLLRFYARALINLGRLGASLEVYEQAIACHPTHEGLRTDLDFIKKHAFFTGPGSLQGFPLRQAFMSATIDLLKDRLPPLRLLEIGSYAGASLLTWMVALGEFYSAPAEILCIDPWIDEGLDDTSTQTPSYRGEEAYQTFLHNARFSPPNVAVAHRRQTSRQAFAELVGKNFDIVYIDGCHRYDEVLADIQDSDRVLKVGGILCGDDLEVQMADCDIGHARANADIDYPRDPNTGTEYHPGVTLAVGEFFGSVSAFHGYWAMRKSTEGYERVEYRSAVGLAPLHWGAKKARLVLDYFDLTGEIRRVKLPDNRSHYT